MLKMLKTIPKTEKMTNPKLLKVLRIKDIMEHCCVSKVTAINYKADMLMHFKPIGDVVVMYHLYIYFDVPPVNTKTV